LKLRIFRHGRRLFGISVRVHGFDETMAEDDTAMVKDGRHVFWSMQ